MGSGSGMNADLLDGLDSSAFVKVTDTSTFGQNSYGSWEKRANGVIEQWGTIIVTGSSGNVISGIGTLPISYSSISSFVVTGNIMTVPSGSWSAATMIIRPYNNTQFIYFLDTTDSGHSFNAGTTFSFRTIGV
jgi:hypothetical protein